MFKICLIQVIRCNDTDELFGDTETFDWTPEQKGLMLGSYYYGYTICTVGLICNFTNKKYKQLDHFETILILLLFFKLVFLS